MGENAVFVLGVRVFDVARDHDNVLAKGMRDERDGEGGGMCGAGWPVTEMRGSEQ